MAFFHNYSSLDFSQTIHFYRCENHYTISQLASMLVMPEEYVQLVEQGEIKPTIQEAIKFAQALHLPIEVFELEASLRTPSTKDGKTTPVQSSLLPIFSFITRKLFIENNTK